MSTTTQSRTLVTYEPPYLIARTHTSCRVLQIRAQSSYSPAVVSMPSEPDPQTTLPTTPRHPKHATNIPSNTPWNKGTAADLEAGLETTWLHMTPYLVEDLKSERVVDLQGFLGKVLGLTTPPDDQMEVFVSIVTDPEYVRLVGEYEKVVGTVEANLYEPFHELINRALSLVEATFFQVRGDDPRRLQFCRNETSPVGGSAATRKPDLVMTDEQCADVRRPAEGGKRPFFWADLLGYIEFKVDHSKKGNAGDHHHTADPFQPGPHSSQTLIHSASRSASGSVVQLLAQSQSSTSSASSKRKFDHSMHTGTDGSGQKKAKPAEEEKGPKEDPRVQCAGYALELLSVGGWRSHVFGALVTDRNIELLYYDRSAIVKAEPFDFMDEPVLFFRVIACLVNLARWRWGLLNMFPYNLGQATYSPPKQTRSSGNVDAAMYMDLDVELKDGTQLKLGKTIALSHGLIGRGTCVVKVKRIVFSDGREIEGKKKHVAKFSWPHRSRVSEPTFLRKAHDTAREGRRDMLDHLPDIVCHEDCLGNEVLEKGLESLVDSYKPRVLRILVFTELLPLTELKDAKEVYRVFYDVFKCYQWLYVDCKIMHRDVSHTNVMFRHTTGGIKGVLNDFDLASMVDGTIPQPSSHLRTGTRTFMAIDLLKDKPPIHMYRHDLESLFYVMVWHCCRFERGQVVGISPCDDWVDRSFETVRKNKLDFLSVPQLQLTKQHEPLTNLLEELKYAFFVGYQLLITHNLKKGLNKAAGTFDEGTLDKKVDFEALDTIFKSFDGKL